MPTDPSGNIRIGNDDERSYASRRVAVWAGAAVGIVLAAAGAWYFLGTDSARSELREAESAARQSAEAGDYGRAVEVLKAAMTKHAGRRDLLPPLEQLLAAVEERQRQAKLDQDYNRLFQQGLEATQQNRWADALAAFEQAHAMRPTDQLRQLIETSRPRAEKARAAAALLAEARAALAQGDFQKTATLAQRGTKDFGDTNEAKEFASLRQQAEAKLAEIKAQRAAELEKQGDEAQKKGDLPGAQTAWQAAHQLTASPALQTKLATVAGQLKRYSDAIAAGKQLLQDARAAKDKTKCANAIRRFEEAKAIRPGAEADSLLAEAKNALAAIQAALAAAEAQARSEAAKSAQQLPPAAAATQVTLRPTPTAQPGAQPAPSAAPAQTSDGFVSLFNGRDLSGWVPIKTSGWWSDTHQPVSDGWAAQQGELACNTKEFVWLRSKRAYGNFVLQLEFKLPRDGHTGVYVRCPDKGRLSSVGMEIQIIDEDFMPRLGATMNPARRYTGAIVGVVGPQRRATRPTGEWNSMEVSCNGDLVQVTVNGAVTASANMSEEPKLRARPRAGYIGLANWRGDANGCAFRNIRIRELPAPTGGSVPAR
ncbi:MAG: DUF1080 domain-containing protein [Verrucomicrobia bacterium]|nr:DUF1080 domain-containing protein [Verrucomicrobiota bacterium]